jgi:RimJ/RimL family protein N-acetyltransferase
MTAKSTSTTRNILLNPIEIEHGNYLVHSFRAEEMKREKSISRDIYAILSDEATLRYLPEKKLPSPEAATLYFRSNLLSYHAGKNYLHFITDKHTEKIVGMIDLISPEVAKEHYQLNHYPYFIEFYLESNAQGRSIMTTLLPAFVSQLQRQHIKHLGAVVNHKNTAARKVLKKAGFVYQSPFDPLQDFYLNTLN